jgi:MSHA biogenesis protein MshE
MTGHLVLSTLHTNDAVATISRLVDMGVERYMVAAALDAIVAQRLVRRVCDSCGQPAPPTPQQRAWVAHQLGPADEARLGAARFLRGLGCTYCNGSGYRGRIGVYELLTMDDALVDALRAGDLTSFAAAARRQAGFRPFTLCALDYALAGVTTLDEVMRVAGGLERYTEPVDLDLDPAPPA